MMGLRFFHPIRFIGILLLAGAAAYGSYLFLEPKTFSYAKVREGVVVPGGSVLQAEHIEEGLLVMGASFPFQGSPLPGLVPYHEAKQYIGFPVSRKISGGTPLLTTDFPEDANMAHVLDEAMTGMSIPVNNIVGVSPELAPGDRVHLYASFENDSGAHSGLLLRDMPVIGIQREAAVEGSQLTGVTIALRVDEAVLLTHALHYGKIRLGQASSVDQIQPGVGDRAFAQALMQTRKRWSDRGEESE